MACANKVVSVLHKDVFHGHWHLSLRIQTNCEIQMHLTAKHYQSHMTCVHIEEFHSH